MTRDYWMASWLDAEKGRHWRDSAISSDAEQLLEIAPCSPRSAAIHREFVQKMAVN